jgi:hypothetical protein
MGDIVKVPKRMWRNFLYQARLATYPTPENIADLDKEMKVQVPPPENIANMDKEMKVHTLVLKRKPLGASYNLTYIPKGVSLRSRGEKLLGLRGYYIVL